jgi:hypothetical protein
LLDKPYINKTEMYAFLALALEVEWSVSHPGHLTQGGGGGGSPQYPLDRRLGRAQRQHAEKHMDPTNIKRCHMKV